MTKGIVSIISKMKKFLKHHNACDCGYTWAMKNCNSIQDVWDKAKPEWLLWLATRKGVLTDRELHESALNSAESVKGLMEDERSLKALEIKRKWLNNEASDDELVAARAAAWVAAWAAAEAARAAARVAAWAVAEAAWVAARVAAWAAARAANTDNADNAAAWLRDNCKPNFEIK